MAAELKLEDMAPFVGKAIGTSSWFLLDQHRIDQFASVTEDSQFIHVDPEAAKQTTLGQTIAHGFLTTSMLSTMMYELDRPEARMSLNYGFNKLRFLTPVLSGSRIRGHFILLDLIEKRPGQWQQTVDVTVEIEGENKPALKADWIFMHFT